MQNIFTFSIISCLGPNFTTLTFIRLSTGIALLYLHLHDVFRDSSFLQRAHEYVSHSLKCLTRRHDVTFLCGDAGPLAVAAVVYYRLQRGPETDECINRSLWNDYLFR